MNTPNRSPLLDWIRNHRGLVAGAVALAVAAAVIVLVWFQPQKLFFDDAVDEAFPVATTAPPTTVPATSTTTTAAGSGEDSTTTPTTTVTSTTVPAGPQLLAGGDFIDLAHAGEGRASVYRLDDGSLVLRFEDLAIDNGPDLRVILSAAPLVDDEGAYDDVEFVDLGELKGNVGNQNYEIDPGIDLAQFATVAIWCRRFNVTFNAAPLTPVGG